MSTMIPVAEQRAAAERVITKRLGRLAMSIVIDTPEGIRFFQLLATRGRLQMEVGTGLKSRISTLAAAKRNFGVLSNTKRGALAELDAMVEGAQDSNAMRPPRFYPGGKLLRAAYHRGYAIHQANAGYMIQLDLNEVADGDGMTAAQFERKWNVAPDQVGR